MGRLLGKLGSSKRSDDIRFVAATLTLELEGDEPPKQFRIFKAGWNEFEGKGRFLFDETAARAVMAAYQAHGVDCMIDLEHLSLDDDGPNFDPDARGWAKLDVRNGELWATSVSWTSDGDARLREKRQRYVSPVFATDKKTKRIVSVLNIALTGMPATHEADELVAANVTIASYGGKMDAALLKQALDAIETDDAEKCKELLKSLIASAAGGPATDVPADPVEEEAATETEPPADEEQAAVMAATSRLTRLTGKDTISAAVDEAETWRASHLKLDAETAKLAKEREQLEASERRKLVAQLVILGSEIPPTAWEKGQEGKKPCQRLRDEPLAELRARVSTIASARGKKPAEHLENVQPPTGDDLGLTERELVLCKEKNIDPKKYAETRAKIRARQPSTATS